MGKENIAILTNFSLFNPGYSLSGIVSDQIKMLESHGHCVHLFVNEKFDDTSPAKHTHKIIPNLNLKDYMSSGDLTPEHLSDIDTVSSILIKKLNDLKIDIVFDHDMLFQGWFVPYNFAIRKANKHLPRIKWFHWIHSIPTGNRDYWSIPDLRPNHKIIYPNLTDIGHVAYQYKGNTDDIRCIHHIKDLRSFVGFSKDTYQFIDTYPSVMQSDIVQLYPASVDRLSAKRVSDVLQILGHIKTKGFSVCLIVANQWATMFKDDEKSKRNKANMDRVKYEAKARGFEVGKDFIFTSEFNVPKFEIGIPREMVCNLFQLSNLFIFPTREETFGLVLPEASLLGGVLTVTNKSLEMMREVSGGNGLSFEFGSYNKPFSNFSGDQYYVDIAEEIIYRMGQDSSLRTKSFMRQSYNWDALYKNEYVPLFKESKEWIS